MNFVSMLAPVLFSFMFESTIDRAFVLARNSEWNGAAAALDQAQAESPDLFAINNLHYLRGRVAENQRDWKRAQLEFAKIGGDNPLFHLASWHAARASVQMRDETAALQQFNNLPGDFPEELKLQLARDADPKLAEEIYRTLSSREARLKLARLENEKAPLWTLIRERQDDDSALEAAHLVAPSASTSRERLDAAGTFMAHRQFDYALPFYQEASKDPAFSAEARYQIARIHFLREHYPLAIEAYRAIAKDYPSTDWEKDSDYQIASCYWRLGDLPNTEKTYLRYISRYGRTGQEEGAVRNLVDVYRAMGEEQKAITWIDRMLAGKLTVAGRQVLQFTKAKILYTQKRYTAAANLFRQLAAARLRPLAGGTTQEEAKYFHALSLSKAGNKAAGETIWRSLVREPLTYYGLRAAEKLGRTPVFSKASPCVKPADAVLRSVRENLQKRRRPHRTEAAAAQDAVTELMYLELWDEASMWFERGARRPDPRTAAELAYAGRRYHRSILYADRLPESDRSAMPLLYPDGFRDLICKAASTYKVDPLWLHAIIWQESKYNPNARSGASARGLMQFIPETAAAVGAAVGLNELSLERLYDPAVIIPMGAYYWGSLVEKVKQPEMALAAYNGGLDNVARWKNKWAGAASDEMELFVADIGFTETKRYVMAVFGARAAYASLVD